MNEQRTITIALRKVKGWWSGDHHVEAAAAALSRFSRVQLCATPQTAARQAPLSLGSSRQEHWSGLPFLSPHMEVIWRLFQQLKVYSQSKMLKLMEVIQFWGINIEHSCETDCLNHSRKVCGRCRGQNEALLLSHFSCVWLCATPQTAAHHAPPPLGFSRQH